MERSGKDQEEGGSELEAPLARIDAELNIFALANGVDLLRNRSGVPDRVLEWYRDGMERRVALRAVAPGRIEIRVEGSGRIDGTPHTASATFRDSLTTEELESGLRELLRDGMERANRIERGELEPAE